MTIPAERIVIDYASARERLLDADVLLFDGFAWYDPALRVIGKSKYVHAALAAWWHKRVHVLQSAPFCDRKPLLSEVLKSRAGMIDVYRCVGLSPSYRELIVYDMIEIVGKGYGWISLGRVALVHVPIVRLLFRDKANDDAAKLKTRPFCSQAVAMCYSASGIDLVPNRADHVTEPGDLAKSALLEYQFTLGETS